MNTSETSPLTKIEQCRICLEEDIPSKFIYPCKCSGTSKYVHDKCLKQWIIMSDNSDYKEKCPTCHYTYKMKNIPISENPLKCEKCFISILINFWGMLLLNQIIIFIGSILLGLLDDGFVMTDQNSSTHHIYNVTQPIISEMTEVNVSPFFVYYTLSCTMYSLTWMIIMTYNICILKENSILYIKKMSYKLVFLSPILLILAIYINMISYIFGTFILTKLISIWIISHLETIEIIKTVKKYKIENFVEEV